MLFYILIKTENFPGLVKTENHLFLAPVLIFNLITCHLVHRLAFTSSDWENSWKNYKR